MEPYSIQKTLRREILLSEKLRARSLAWIFVYAIIILFLIRLFLSDYFLLWFSKLSLIYIIQATLVLFIIRETIIIRLIQKSLDTDKDVPDIVRYISNLIEISYPTIILIILVFHSDSTIILFSPVVYFYFLILILSTLSLEFRISFYAGIWAAIGYIVIFLLITRSRNGISDDRLLEEGILHFGKAAILIIGGVVTGFVANQIKKKILKISAAQLERNQIINMFGQQISASIVDELISSNNKIESEEKYACVMFLDIREFSRFAENKKPDEIISYQNHVFGFMIDIIIKHHGTINQFLGDGYMATFGVPLSKGNDSQNAVNAALEIIDVLSAKNDRGEIPNTRIGIGLHSGFIITGNVGTDERKQYSISGNPVIIASRIEQLNKTYKSQLLISKEVLDKIDKENIEPRLLGDVKLKGRGKPVEIWQLK